MTQEHSISIHDLLVETKEKNRRLDRQQILKSMGIAKEYFEDGDIEINNLTCDGVECKLCIEACPSNALYWDDGKVKVEKSLCIYCCACVLSCIVDDCIRVMRKRSDDGIEKFSTPKGAFKLCTNIASSKRIETTKNRFFQKEPSRTI